MGHIHRISQLSYALDCNKFLSVFITIIYRGSEESDSRFAAVYDILQLPFWATICLFLGFSALLLPLLKARCQKPSKPVLGRDTHAQTERWVFLKAKFVAVATLAQLADDFLTMLHVHPFYFHDYL